MPRMKTDRLQVTAASIVSHPEPEIFVRQGQVLHTVDFSANPALLPMKDCIALIFSKDAIKQCADRTFFAAVSDDPAVMVCRMHTIIGENAVDVVERPPPRHHQIK